MDAALLPWREEKVELMEVGPREKVPEALPAQSDASHSRMTTQQEALVVVEIRTCWPGSLTGWRWANR